MADLNSVQHFFEDANKPKTIIDLALNCKSTEFLAHPIVQGYLDMLWYEKCILPDQIHVDSSKWKRRFRCLENQTSFIYFSLGQKYLINVINFVVFLVAFGIFVSQFLFQSCLFVDMGEISGSFGGEEKTAAAAMDACYVTVTALDSGEPASEKARAGAMRELVLICALLVESAVYRL